MIKVFSIIVKLSIALVIFGCFCAGCFLGQYINFRYLTNFLCPVFGLIIGVIVSAVIFGPILILINIQENIEKIETKVLKNN